MPASRSHPFLFAAGLVTVGTAAGYAGSKPALAAVIALGALIALSARRLDGWQRVYSVTVVLMLCAASNVEVLTRFSFHARYVAVTALVVWTFVTGTQGRRSLRSLGRPARWLIGGLWAAAALAVCSTAWSVNRMETLQQSIALGLLAALVHAMITRRWADPRVIGKDLGIAYVLLVLCFTASLAYDVLGGENSRTYGGRLQGIFANPNTLSVLCAMSIPVGWSLYRRSQRPLALAGIVPAVVALVLSESRTALLAVAIGGFWVLARSGLGAMVRCVCAVALTVTALQLFGGFGLLRGAEWANGLADRFTAPEGGDVSNGRIFAWQLTLDFWEARPGVGYGYAAGPSLFESTRQSDFFDFQGNSVHNSYLQWVLELGLAGAAVLLLLGLACLVVVFRGNLHGVGSGLVWLVVTGLLVQLTESAMFGTGQPYPYLFWLAVAAALAHTGHVRPAGPRHLRRWGAEVPRPTGPRVGAVRSATAPNRGRGAGRNPVTVHASGAGHAGQPASHPGRRGGPASRGRPANR
ncbi:O-antigen ligase family protein [Micromonospora musae]|uniref:O-antigen ligase family protein n=1 Tax=Micromonospora musae TaxID=1894970 RepID=UPI00340EA1BC